MLDSEYEDGDYVGTLGDDDSEFEFDDDDEISLVVRVDDFDNDETRDDLFEILGAAPDEVPGLLKAIQEGRINGDCYSGECACLVGTIANLRGVSQEITTEWTDHGMFFRGARCEMPGIGNNAGRPAEVLFFHIDEGMTPNKCGFSALAERFVMEWIERQAEKDGDL